MVHNHIAITHYHHAKKQKYEKMCIFQWTNTCRYLIGIYNYKVRRKIRGELNNLQLPKTREVFVSRHFWVHFVQGVPVNPHVLRVHNMYGKGV